MSDTVETEVILDADGQAVFRAIDQVAKKIAEIQNAVSGITEKAKAASNAFGGGLQKTLNDLNKTVSTLERFQATVQKYDPQYKASQDAAALEKQRAKDIDAAYRSQGAVARTEAQKTYETEKAYAARQAENQEKNAKQQAQLWAKNDQVQLNSRVSMEQRLEKVAEERIARLNKLQLEGDKKLDAERQNAARIAEQNRIKQLRDMAQQSVSSASPRDLAGLQAASGANLNALRAQRGVGTPEEQRQLEQNIALEKQYLGLVEQRIAAEDAANARIDKSDSRVNAGLDIRSGKINERALATQLDLDAAKQRQLDLEMGINAQIAQAYRLTGDDKIAAEQALKVDEARLGVIKQRVAALKAEALQAEKDAAKEAAAGNKTGGGLFGSSGLTGIVARTAAYGMAAGAIYGTLSTIKEGIAGAIEYEDTIQKIGAIADLTSTQMGGLSDTIAKVSENSRFARQDIAEAATTLAQAGFSMRDIESALGSINELAASSGSTFAEATDVVTSALGAFNLSASDSQHVADTLTSALNLTKLNIQQVAAGIQYAGATAYENNMTFEDLTATMAALAQAGIKSGSTMGTGVRQLLALLLSPTTKFSAELKKLGLTMDDINVKTLGLTGVMDNLTKAGFTAADAYKSLETRGAAVYLALRNQQDVALKVAQAQELQKAATNGNAKAMDSLTAQWQKLKNQLSDAVTEWAAPYIYGLTGIGEAMDKAAAKQKELGDAQDYFNQKFGDSDEGILKTLDAMGQYEATMAEMTDREKDHADAAEKVNTAVNNATEAADHEKQTLSSLEDAITRVSVRKQMLTQDSAALAAETLNLEGRFQGLAGMLDGTAMSYDNLTSALTRYRQAELQKVALTGGLQVNADNKAVSQFATAGGQDLHQLKNSQYWADLPANIKKAVETAQKSTGYERTQAVIEINDYANDPNNHMLAQGKRMLTDYSGSAAQLGLAMGRRSDSQMSVDTARLLMGNVGEDLFSKIQSTNDVGGLQSLVKDIAGRMKGKTGAAYNALGSLLQNAASKLSLVQPPQPQDHKERTKKPKVDRLPERQDRAVDAEAVKADDAELKQGIKGLLDAGGTNSVGPDGTISVTKAKTLTAARLNQNLDRITNDNGTGALDQWVDDRTKQVEDQLKNLKLDKDSGKGKAMWDDLQREIAAKREDVSRQIGEQIAKALDSMVQAVEKTAKRAEEAADHSMDMVQSRLTALGRASMDGKVPDYVQQTVERQVAAAKDTRDYAQIGINDKELAGYQSVYDQASVMTDTVAQRGLLDKLDPALKSVDELHDKIEALKNANEKLKASFGGQGLLPQGFNANLQMAIANYREVNHLTDSWSQMIDKNLTGAFGAAQDAMTQFFSDVLSGNASVTQSFATMVKAVIGYLSQMIAKMIAAKLMDAALNLLGGAKLGGGQITGDAGSSFMQQTDFGFLHRIHGGAVTALSGRYITDGVPNRDSVDAKIAKGEYVVQKMAVDSVGVDFMDKLNKRGASALKDMGPKIVMPAPSNQLMNVYVVSPDHQPTMGPNDVLVTIANDIGRGGMTKQLIKQVAQGG